MVGRPWVPAAVAHSESHALHRQPTHLQAASPNVDLAPSPEPGPGDDAAEASQAETAQLRSESALRSEIEQLRTDLAAATLHAQHLATALESNRTIGAAVGILMTRLRIPEQQAFELLRTVSQQSNRKLRLVAAGVVYTGNLEMVRRPATVGGARPPRP